MKDKINILIVEDELTAALDLKFYLKKRGYNIIRIVCTGKEAINSVSTARPDVVLLDINLKGSVNGLQAAEEFLDFKIPVFFINANRCDYNIKKMQKFYSNCTFKSYSEFTPDEDLEKILRN